MDVDMESDRSVPQMESPGTFATAQNQTSSTGGIERIKSVLETRRKMFLVTVLEAASATTISENELCIEYAPDARHFRDTLTKSENIKILRDACQEVIGKEVGVRIIIQDPELNSVPASREEEERREKQSLRESVEQNPVVQQMLRTFRGEIVDVRRVDPDA